MMRTIQPPRADDGDMEGPGASSRKGKWPAVAMAVAAAVVAATVAVVAATGPDTAVRQEAGPASEQHNDTEAAPGATPTTAAPTEAAQPPAPAPAPAPPSCAAAAPAPPTPRFGAAVSAEATGLVAFGGRGSDFKDIAETWSFGCGRWGTRASGPPPEWRAVAAFDAARGTTVLLAADSSTWLWVNNEWTRAKPAASPPLMDTSVLAFDDARDRVVVYGSAKSDGAPQTWAWDGTTWSDVGSASAPSIRANSAFAWDGSKAVLFGGVLPGNKGSDETWAFDGSRWSKLSPAVSPPRGSSVSAYDPVNKRVVLLASDGTTWTWDGGAWAKQSPAQSPGRRLFAGMTWAPALNRVVVFGGKLVRTKPGATAGDEEIVNDLWAWDGTTWSRLS